MGMGNGREERGERERADTHSHSRHQTITIAIGHRQNLKERMGRAGAAMPRSLLSALPTYRPP